MKIVSFDLGQHFAWASNLKGHAWGHIDLEGIRSHRFCQLTAFLQKQLWMQNCDAAVYEEPFVRGKDATRSLWGYAAIVEAYTTFHKLPVIGINLRTVKKFATNSGMAAKSDMLIAAKRLGYKGVSSDEADAWCLLKYAETMLERAPSM